MTILSTSPNSDPFVIAMSILLFAQLVVVWGQKNQLRLPQLGLLTVTALALTLSKPEYLLLAIAICFIPGKLPTQTQKLYVRFVLPFLLILTALLWNYEVNNITTAAAHLQRGPSIVISESAQLKNVLLNPFRFLYITLKSALENSWFNGIISLLGYNFVVLPAVVIGYLAIILSWATIYKSKVKTTLSQDYKKGSIFLGVAILCAGSIVTALYLAYNSVGSSTIGGVQGRYFLPVLPFFMYGLSYIIPIKMNMSKKWATLLFPASVIICLIISVAWYYKITYLPL
ncbi:MAG TPA: DUF2142 domain-containing protein [Candidatus Saccharimonadales bacterium]|nr:DUF2142 domain-containing protein [Candidatus Saccharimonadales bacterium]